MAENISTNAAGISIWKLCKLLLLLLRQQRKTKDLGNKLGIFYKLETTRARKTILAKILIKQKQLRK